MRYRITHRTTYTYDAPVHESFNEVRLRPLSDETQTCLDFTLTIDPPATVITFADYYGNAVHDFSVPYLHDRLRIEATSDVVTFADADQPLAGPRDDDPDRSPPLAGLVDEPVFANDHAEFLIPSEYVALVPPTQGIARAILETDPLASAWGFLCAAADVVRQRLEYRLGTTNVHSTVVDVLAGESGVCQDFSHVLISICRQAGLPARYVSGYQGSVPEAEASHAWVEAFIPPYGWVGVDPTTGGACTGRHVKIAVGRDYADVTVVRGTYRGGRARDLEVAVQSETVTGDRGLVLTGGGRRRGEMMQFQRLGTMRQLQQMGVMRQTRETAGTALAAVFDAVPMMRLASDEENAPHSQPQQQQQGGPACA
jgi:transglutaminase-like putative cysteine protease